MKQVTEVISDDITGEPDARTVTFGFEGVSFEIDLTEANRTAMMAALAPYLDNGRKVRNGQPLNRKPAPPREFDLAEIRAWAAINEISLPQRGRIPADIVELFNKRNNQHERVKVKAGA